MINRDNELIQMHLCLVNDTKVNKQCENLTPEQVIAVWNEVGSAFEREFTKKRAVSYWGLWDVVFDEKSPVSRRAKNFESLFDVRLRFMSLPSQSLKRQVVPRLFEMDNGKVTDVINSHLLNKQLFDTFYNEVRARLHNNGVDLKPICFSICMQIAVSIVVSSQLKEVVKLSGLGFFCKDDKELFFLPEYAVS
jgi:hypothetical protein